MSITKLNNLSVSALTALPSGVGGKVLQVVQGTQTASVTTSSASFVTLGLSASITPSSASNKILVILNATIEQTATAHFDIDRSGTLISAVTNGLGSIQSQNVNIIIALNFLDSPNTTSSTTYTLFGKTNGTLYFDPNTFNKASIVLMEIAP